jgi:hypothetical protein
MPRSRTKSERRAARPERVPEASLKISEGLFSEEAVMRLIDHLVVPALVEEFLRNKDLLERVSGSKGTSALHRSGA